MEEADLLVAVGTRFVCQSDCSRTGYPKVEAVININTDSTTSCTTVKAWRWWAMRRPTLRRLHAV